MKTKGKFLANWDRPFQIFEDMGKLQAFLVVSI